MSVLSDYSLWFVILGAIFLFFFLDYVLDAVVKQRVFRIFGTCNPLLAWVPFYSSYMLGHTCTGQDGQNMGLFGVSMSNTLWEFGWALPFLASALQGFLSIRIQSVLMLSSLFSIACFVIKIIYYGSIYTFLYSRLEPRSIKDVSPLALLSAVIGLVGVVKILAEDYPTVYSIENDVYPDRGYQSRDRFFF